MGRWHPDRYADDPQGQAEAAQRRREINAAYALVRQHGPRNSSHTVSAESDGDAVVRP